MSENTLQEIDQETDEVFPSVNYGTSEKILLKILKQLKKIEQNTRPPTP